MYYFYGYIIEIDIFMYDFENLINILYCLYFILFMYLKSKQYFYKKFIWAKKMYL